MRVLIVGCGYIGTAIGTEMVAQGHEVWGLRRSSRANAGLKAAGIRPLNADITDVTTLPKAGPCYEKVVHCVSTSGGGAMEYRQVYLQGTRNLLNWLSAAPPVQLVYTGSTSVYGQTDGSLVDESSPTEPPTATGRVLVETEQLLLETASRIQLGAIVLRLGAIYGPGRAYWVDQFRAGTAKLQGQGDRLLNLIHRDDAAGAVMAALARGAPGIYNVVDDKPVSQLKLFEWLSKRLNRAFSVEEPGRPARPAKRGLTHKRVSNSKLKRELGYRLKFPTFRDGFEEILLT